MGARDTEEQLEACKADAILLERQLAAAEAKLAAITALCDRIDVDSSRHVHERGTTVVEWVRQLLGEQPADVLLTPDEVDVVAPVLLEAGTRHLERGTAWHELGHRLHAIAERLYETTHRQETTRA